MREFLAMTKLITTVGLFVGLALAGCGGSQKGGGANGDCQAAATNMGNLLRAELGGEDEAAEVVPKLQSIVAERCTADRWAKAATDCIAKSTTTAELDACEQTITKAQQESLKNAMNAEMEAMSGDKGEATSAPPPAPPEGGGGGDPCGDGADPCGGGE